MKTWSNTHLQTILGAYAPDPSHDRAPFQTGFEVSLPDGDTLKCWEGRPDLSGSQAIPKTPASDKVVIILHGLGGDTNSRYVRRVSKRILDAGHLVVGMNMRGCGESTARGLGHSGRSEDLRAVIAACTARYPTSSFVCLGFSMGGNIVLKYLAEAVMPEHRVVGAMVVCPPADLAASADKIHTGALPIYERYLLRALERIAKKRQRSHPDLPHPSLDLSSLRAFDEYYTAPLSGFKNADHYYRVNSSAPRLVAITVPTFILSADDDPFVDNTFLATHALPHNVSVTRRAHGGHLGFLGWHNYRLQRQMDDWIVQVLGTLIAS